MSKRLTNYKNKIINEVNELYPDIINDKEKGGDYCMGGLNQRVINKKSKLKNLKELKFFVGDILKIEDIIIRRPVEDDIYIDDVIGKIVPYYIYECVIVKSIRENKYYTLNIDCLKQEEIKYIVNEIEGYLISKNKNKNTIKPDFYIYDITNHLYLLKLYKDMENDVDFNECYRLLRNEYQNSKSLYDDYSNSLFYYD